MSDAATETVSVMLQFGQSSIPIARDLAGLMLDALRSALVRDGKGGRGGGVASKAASKVASSIPGMGHEGEVSMSTLMSDAKDRELVSIPVEREDLEALRKQLKAYHVTFAVMEDPVTGGISIHAKASDYSVIEKALEGVIRDIGLGRTEREQDMWQGDGEAAKLVTGDQQVVAEVIKDAQGTYDVMLDPKDAPMGMRLDTMAQAKMAAEAMVASQAVEAAIGEGASMPSGADAQSSWETIEPGVAEMTEAASGFTLVARDDGRASVRDEKGAEVWSGRTAPGNIEASKRLAARGLEAHRSKESLQLGPDDHRAERAEAERTFDRKLSHADAQAARENAEMGAKGLQRAPGRAQAQQR